MKARLAVVTSAVCKSITLDLATKEKHKLSYACVCVELDAILICLLKLL